MKVRKVDASKSFSLRCVAVDAMSETCSILPVWVGSPRGSPHLGVVFRVGIIFWGQGEAKPKTKTLLLIHLNDAS